MIKSLILKIIRFYQKFISPALGKHCRFYPSCSEYCCLVIQKYGIIKGAWKGMRRILRCHPWNPGGIDQP